MQRVKRVFGSRILAWAIAAIATGLAVTFAILWQTTSSPDEGREELESQASSFVLALTNFSSETIDEDVEEIRAFATGAFADEVDELFSEETVEAIKSAGASSEAEISALFVQEMDEDSATVFAVVSESIDNQTLEQPRTDIVRMEVSLVLSGDEWKVDAVELFQSPGDIVAPAG